MSGRARRLASPLGELLLVADAGALLEVRLPGGPSRRAHEVYAADGGTGTPDATADVLSRAAGELEAYFAGSLTSFHVPLHLQGTPFQRMVWETLLTIPFGETRSYTAVATAVGHPGAARAVGRAVGCNPIAVIVPCHRVVGSDGGVTGYAGGLPAKALLLRLECPALSG